jgi:hypothetical protein
MKITLSYGMLIALLAAPLPAAAQATHIERRPCVAPGAPSGCDGTISTGPKLSPGGGAPSPEMRYPDTSTVTLPLHQAPPPAETPPPPEGSVEVGPAPDQKAPVAKPRPHGTSGPQAAH